LCRLHSSRHHCRKIGPGNQGKMAARCDSIQAATQTLPAVCRVIRK
jgi:hypothetical protein